MTNRFINPPGMSGARGYTHVVETAGAARTVYLAGQFGITPDGKFAGAPGDFRAQATQCFENIRTGLAAVGGSWNDVVKITNFFVDMSHLPIFFEVRDSFVNTSAPPASTAVQIVTLARPEAVFEIEAIAVIQA